MNNTQQDIQGAIIEDLQAIFEGQTFKTPTGKERALKFFRQEIPQPKVGHDDEDVDMDLLSVPYCLVKILDGSFDEWNYTRTISAAVIFCIYDNSPEKKGASVIMDLIDQAFKHYAQTQNIGNSLIKLPLEWSLQTDLDTHPFYFGAFHLVLEAPGVEFPVSNDSFN